MTDTEVERPSSTRGKYPMLRWALVFAILAVIAGLLGFYGLEGNFAYIAKILVFVFLVLFVVSLIFGRRTEPIV